MSASKQTSPARDRLLHVGMQRGNRFWIRQRANIGLRVERIAEFQRLHPFDKSALELVRNRFGNDETFGRDARLPVVDDASIHRSRNRRLQIGARHHDEWIAPAQLKNYLLNTLRRGDAYLHSGFLAAGQGCGEDARIVENVLHLLGPDEQRLETSFRETGLAKYGFNLQSA